MAFAIVQTLESGPITLGQASRSITPTAGNHVLAMVYWSHPSDATITISGLGTGTQNFTLIGTPQRRSFSGAQQTIQLAYIASVDTTGAKTVGLTMSSSSSSMSGGFVLLELSGGDAAALLDASLAADGISASPTLTLNTATNNAAIFAICVASTSTSDPTAGSGYTLIPVTNFSAFVSAEYDLDAETAGGKTVNFGLSASGGWILAAASLKLAGSGVLTKFQEVTLVDEAGAPLASLTGLKVYGYDIADPAALATTLPTDYTASGSTNASGVLRFDRPNTALAAGSAAFLMITTSNGTLAQSPAPRSFLAPVQIQQEGS